MSNLCFERIELTSRLLEFLLLLLMLLFQFVESGSIEIFVVGVALCAHLANELVQLLIDVLQFDDITTSNEAILSTEVEHHELTGM